MEFKEVLTTRYSVREFEERPVEREIVARVLEAARIAPTAANKQPWRILAIAGKSAMEKLAQCTRFLQKILNYYETEFSENFSYKNFSPRLAMCLKFSTDKFSGRKAGSMPSSRLSGSLARRKMPPSCLRRF